MSRRNRSRSRSRRHSNSEFWTWALGTVLAVLFLMIVVGFAYLRWTAERKPVLDAETLCPMDGGARSTTVVLLDTSDQWPDITREEVRKRLEQLSEQIPPYGLLELRLLDPAVTGGRITFAKCNPGDGSNLNEITGNPKLARKKWLEQFVSPLQQALDQTLTQTESDTSPILSTVQRISVERFDDNHPGSLILVSDMIEHTPDYSQYKGDLSYQRYKQSAAYKKQHTDLHGADVTILRVQRLQMDSLKLMQFWAEWTVDNNGHFNMADQLQGAD